MATSDPAHNGMDSSIVSAARDLEGEMTSVRRLISITLHLLEDALKTCGSNAQPAGYVQLLLTKDQAEDLEFAASEAMYRVVALESRFANVLEGRTDPSIPS